MNDNHWSWIGIAAFIGFALLRAAIRALRGKAASPMDRINAAAKRVLQEQKTRSSVPLTKSQAKSQAMSGAMSGAQLQSGAARASSQSQQRQHAQNQAHRVTNTARPVSAQSTPAVIRRGAGLLSGTREPVIQRRR